MVLSNRRKPFVPTGMLARSRPSVPAAGVTCVKVVERSVLVVACSVNRVELDTRQVPSLVRPVGYEPPVAKWMQYGADHKVRAVA